MCLIFQTQCFIFLEITSHIFLNGNLTESTEREVSVYVKIEWVLVTFKQNSREVYVGK